MRKLSGGFLTETYEADTMEEAKAAAEQEAHVCGDWVSVQEDVVYVYNFHWGSWRWRCYVKAK